MEKFHLLNTVGLAAQCFIQETGYTDDEALNSEICKSKSSTILIGTTPIRNEFNLTMWVAKYNKFRKIPAKFVGACGSRRLMQLN